MSNDRVAANTTASNSEEVYDGLREWARGLYPLEAATELLIRTDQARPGREWVRWDEGRERFWIDFASIPDHLGYASGGERRLLLIAASLGTSGEEAGEGVVVDLNDVFSGLDRDRLDLVLAAIAHAGGSHQHSRMEKRLITPDNGTEPYEIDFPVIGGGYADPLHSWPAPSVAGA